MSHLHQVDAGVWVLNLPYSAPPLTLNDRIHYRQKAKLTSAMRTVARDLAIDLGIPPMVRPSVQLVWLVTTRHARDADNIVPTLKALADGLVDAKVARDDTPELMHKPMPIIAYARGHEKAPGMHLVIWEQEGPTEAEVRAVEALGVKLGVEL